MEMAAEAEGYGLRLDALAPILESPTRYALAMGEESSVDGVAEGNAVVVLKRRSGVFSSPILVVPRGHCKERRGRYEGPGSSSKSTLMAHARPGVPMPTGKPKPKPKKPTTACLASTMETMSATLQTILDRQQALEKGVQENPVTSAMQQPLAHQVGDSTSEVALLAKSMHPPLRTIGDYELGWRSTGTFSPSVGCTKGASGAREGEQNFAQALTDQSAALNTVVAHLAASGSDTMGDLVSGTTAPGSRGAAGRARLDLAQILTLSDDPPASIFTNKQIHQISRARAFAPLADQKWVTTSLAFMKELDTISAKRLEPVSSSQSSRVGGSTDQGAGRGRRKEEATAGARGRDVKSELKALLEGDVPIIPWMMSIPRMICAVRSSFTTFLRLTFPSNGKVTPCTPQSFRCLLPFRRRSDAAALVYRERG